METALRTLVADKQTFDPIMNRLGNHLLGARKRHGTVSSVSVYYISRGERKGAGTNSIFREKQSCVRLDFFIIKNRSMSL
jgi:hypothetical protein